MKKGFKRLEERHQKLENILNLESMSLDSLKSVLTRAKNISDDKIFFVSKDKIIPKKEYLKRSSDER